MQKGDDVETVEPKMMQVLAVLATNAGEPVQREVLHETVWAGTIVTDDVLTRSVSELRKLFDDQPRQPHVIETIPKVGYRLIAPVRWDVGGDTVPHIADLEVHQAPVFASNQSRPWLPWLGGFACLIVGGMLAFVAQRTPSASPPVERPVTTLPGIEFDAAISPDGAYVAFIGQLPESALQY